MAGRTGFTVTVESDAFVADMKRAVERLELVTTLVATDLAHEAAEEGGQISPQLGEDWDVTGMAGARHVEAPVWWAAFVAHGTQAHGPARASKLHFFVGDDEVYADFVEGLSANPFDERAIEKTRSHMHTIIERAIRI